MPPTSVILSATLYHALIVMARASPTTETCALLGGSDNRLTSIYPVTNVATDPGAAFLLDAAGQIAAMKMMREVGESLRGIFHSHPATPAIPSATDKTQAAYPDVYYVIASLANSPPDLKAYYYDGHEFRSVCIDDG